MRKDFLTVTRSISSLVSKQPSTRLTASLMTGLPAPCADSEPISSWSKQMTTLTPASAWRPSRLCWSSAMRPV